MTQTSDLFITSELLDSDEYFVMEKNVPIEDWLVYEPPLWMFECYETSTLTAEWGNKEREYEMYSVRHYWTQLAAMKDPDDVTLDDVALLQDYFKRSLTAVREAGI